MALVLSACSAAPPGSEVHDPYEVQNRRTHDFNKSVDRNLLRPVSNGYGNTLPDPLRKGVGNFASNLTTPSYFVNDVLQANIDDAAANAMRFLINTTFGIGGLFDPATAWGLPERSADFGETLHVWGVQEGAYVELPFLGPSTERDAVGKVVDLFTNPLTFTLGKPEAFGVPAARGLAGVGNRYRFRELVDSVLYDSEDSYALARLLYLDSRRFQLSGSSGAETGGEIDPYGEIDGIDPYAE